MYQSIVFDLDGTLLNTLTDLANSCNYALEQLGRPTHPVDAYKQFVGSGRDNLIRRALGDGCSDEMTQRAIALFGQHYADHGEDETTPYDGILPMLKRLQAAGIRCAVVSNKPEVFCRVLVPKYFGDLISVAMGHRDGEAPKPDPHLVLEAMAQMGATPDETLYVGDSGVDMQTATNSNLPACGVLWGFRAEEELLANGANFLCRTVEELERLIFTQRV